MLVAAITCKALKPLGDDLPFNMQVIIERSQSFSIALFIHLKSATTEITLCLAHFTQTSNSSSICFS